LGISKDIGQVDVYQQYITTTCKTYPDGAEIGSTGT